MQTLQDVLAYAGILTESHDLAYAGILTESHEQAY